MMLPTTNDNLNGNTNVLVTADEQVAEADCAVVGNKLKNTNVTEPINDNLTKATPAVVKSSLFHKLRISKTTKNTETKDQSRSVSKKSFPSKSKLFDIFKFADIYDILLMVFGTIVVLAANAAYPLMMWLFQSVTNSLIDAGKQKTGATNSTSSSDQCYNASSLSTDPYSTISGIIKWYAILGSLSLIFYWVAYACWMIAAERQLHRIRYTLFKNILRQEIAWFDCQSAGELTNHLVEDLENIRDGIGFRLAEFISLSSRIIAGIIFSLYTGWKLTLVFLSISPLIIASFNLTIRVIRKYTKLELLANSTSNSIAQEVLGAVRTVTAFSGQKKEVERYRISLTESKRISIQKGLIVGLTLAINNLVLYGGIAIIFWYGPYLIRTECKNYTVGHMMVIFMICLASTFLIANLVPNLQAFAEASGSSEYVFEIIQRVSKIDVFSEEGDIPSTFTGNIELKDVHFTFPTRLDAPILNGLNMKIPSGKTVALCGPSGCGKTTIMHLLQRFYDPDQGQILVDDCDIRSLNLKWLRSNIGIVSQEPVLFFGSIEDNIRFGKPNATENEIIDACKLANAHDFIMELPDNYKTSVGDKLSGGQKQRVAIARALVSNPKILLLDEATSALDNRSEKLVQDALYNAKEGRTTIIIAHRLSTIKNADLIVGIQHGQVIEYGSHNQLMERKGLYYELVTAQSEEEETKNDENPDDTDDQLEEKLANQTAAGNVHRMSRRMSIMIKRRSSIVSSYSINSAMENEIVRNNLTIDNEPEKVSLLSVPFIIKILRLNSSEWFYMLIGGIATLAFGGVIPAYALIFSQIYGVLVEQNLTEQENQIQMYTYIIFLVGVGAALTQLISSFALAKSSGELTMRIRVLAFANMLRQEIGWFDFEENNIGILITRLSNDANALKGFTNDTLSAFLNTIGTVVGAIAISFSAGWKLTLTILAFAPLMIVAGVIQGQSMARAGKKKAVTSNAEEGGKYATLAIENIRTIVSLHQEETFIQRYKQSFDSDFRSRMFTLHYTAIGNSLANSLMFFIHATAFGYGSQLVQNNEMAFQDVFKVFIVVTSAALSIGRSVSMMPNYSRSKQSALQILELTKCQSKIDPDDPSGITLSEVAGNIEFRDVRFRYPARPKLRVLRNFSLTCDSGSTTAVVGPSGSGKSTCIALIQRFYEPLCGTIRLDGHDIRTLNIQWLRSLLALVQQEPILFDLSIRENIAYGDNTRLASFEQIQEAAKKANIHDLIISLPEGYETKCGTKGGRLSGGQKQRIAIARALIRSPKILLLDEATSALDNKSEQIVLKALDKAQSDRTSITIAHRLSTIRNAKKIAVVDHGRIKESGRHEQLLLQGGIYYKLNIAQQRTQQPVNHI